MQPNIRVFQQRETNHKPLDVDYVRMMLWDTETGLTNVKGKVVHVLN
jgi:hypothetical protein